MSRILLKTEDHSRDSAGMRYVYPVISRRAGGVSVGINLNPNNACNWRCIYCQVPDLTRGGPPPIDLALLERELNEFLHGAVAGDFMATRVPAGSRRLVDVAFSGNGEPTSAREFAAAVGIAERVLVAHGLGGKVPMRLITNGSLLDRKAVQAGIAHLGRAGGEVWFKVDSASDEGLAAINSYSGGAERQRRNLELCARLCPTWIQTCWLAIDGRAPSELERGLYLQQIESLVKANFALRGVLLYSIARDSYQPEAPRLSPIAERELREFATEIEQRGVRVEISP